MGYGLRAEWFVGLSDESSQAQVFQEPFLALVIFSLGNDTRSKISHMTINQPSPKLDSTLETIAKHGSKGFYEGEIANYTIAAIQSQNGTMTHSDLRDYRVSIRKPISITYRNYTIFSYELLLHYLPAILTHSLAAAPPPAVPSPSAS
jgi:hypothetical protein